MAFVRLLMTRARWNLLDEVTSSVDEALEQHLYGELIKAMPESTIISVAHRSTLRRFHQQELHLSVDSGAQWRAITDV